MLLRFGVASSIRLSRDTIEEHQNIFKPEALQSLYWMSTEVLYRYSQSHCRFPFQIFSQDEITQSALTEIQVLLRFRDPGLPILLGYTYAEDPDNPGTIRLELFTQWHEMRSIASWIQSTQPVEWNINARIQVLYKLAKTLDFLLTNQSAYVFHQNLCTRTVVLQSQCHPILVDFTKALIINKETDKTVSIQEANQSGAILRSQRKDVVGFAKVCLEVWSHQLWEDTQNNDDLTDMNKEEKLTLIKQILDDKEASTDHSKSNCSKECSVHDRMGQLISLLLCEDVYSEIGLMTKVILLLFVILLGFNENVLFSLTNC
ncbi:hypothetical protein FGIG_08284 [Fasciola gigantica]|uniref:Protein kinase domain-containing protein n=1 Tax=Fasciola gigantica TaxID=46835 RepID=A0A504YF49_FASGI|nr:hypothetical protein FGIG_08284 [Fasciola gigantica]